MEKENFEELKKENEEIRTNINKLLDIPKLTKTKKYFKASIWKQINELVENELEQEKLCGS